MLLSDKSIRALCEGAQPMISPFVDRSVKVDANGKKIASYGLSSGGYDFRAKPKFKLFIPPMRLSFWQRLKWLITGRFPAHEHIDFKDIRPDQFIDVEGDRVHVPPGGFLLASTPELVNMPRDVLGLCTGKSTLARAGWSCLSTPIEPGFQGHITLEFQNTTNRTNVFYANEGCLQILFYRLDQPCEVSYSDRGGKYNGQGDDIILPRV